MTQFLATLVVVAIVALTARRAALLVASLLRPRPLPQARALPAVAVLVPARDEALVAPRLLEALSRLDYPAAQLSFVLVSDGSSDDTAALFRSWAVRRADAQVLELRGPSGKAAALNAGLRATAAELVVVVDADLQPMPGFLRELARAFADDTVGAAAAYLAPENPDQNPVTRYAAVTTWVHQLVTSAGTDRLHLSPPTLGAAAYRRVALEAIGGFPVVPVGEDVATSGRLSRQGWRIRFVPTAVARNTLVADVRQYWRQHVRWSRSTFEIRPPQADAPREPGTPAEPLAQRLESIAASTGYLDRLVFAVAVVGAVSGVVPPWAPLLYATIPGLAILAALHKAGARRAAPRFLAATVALFAIDLAASAAGIAAQLTRQPQRWHHSRQAPGR